MFVFGKNPVGFFFFFRFPITTLELKQRVEGALQRDGGEPRLRRPRLQVERRLCGHELRLPLQDLPIGEVGEVTWRLPGAASRGGVLKIQGP